MKALFIMITLLAALLLAGCGSSTQADNTAADENAKIVQVGLQRGKYLPNPIVLEAGEPVTLKNDGTLRGCGLYVVQPELGINANFARQDTYTFTPTKEGEFPFTCSMGMYSGKIVVR